MKYTTDQPTGYSLPMKRKAESAYIEDMDSGTEQVLEDTRLNASIFLPAEGSRARRRARQSLDKDNVQSSHWSRSLGPLLNLLQEHAPKQDEELLTILAGKYHDNAAVWKDCELAMKNCRVFYFAGKPSSHYCIAITILTHVFPDEIITCETATYAEREIIISRHGDINHPDPSIIIAQRTYDATNAIQLRAHKLYFNGKIDLDRSYIFPRRGDEIPGVGGACPALHCTFRAIEQFNQYSRFGQFAGFDRNITIEVAAEDVKTDRRIMYDFARDAVIVPQEDEPVMKPAFGVSIQAGDLPALLLPSEQDEDVKNGAHPYLSPPFGTGRGGVNGGRGAVEVQPKRSVCISILGAGPKINGHSFNADINVRFSVG